MTFLRGGIRHSLWSALSALLLAHPAVAQTRACADAFLAHAADSTTLARPWSAPLDRIVTTSSLTTTLRDALGRVARLANVRVSYSAELVPLDRRVCLRAQGAPLGEVLGALLAGTGVVPVSVGGDQIALAPRASGTGDRTAVEVAPSISVLETMVVTSSALRGAERRATTSTDVLGGRDLARERARTLSDILAGDVPGIWSWTQSPASLLASYGSIRGASSFGLSYPKIYIDGIEVANPLLVTRFAADAVDRVEVIRGPQGAALYGADAISGVVNIVTRHEGNDGGNHATLSTSAGVVQSAFSGNVLTQHHTLSLATGTSTRSANLSVSAGSVGDFIPDGYSRDLIATGSARLVRDRSTFSATGRFFTQRSGRASSPLLTDTGGTSTGAPPQGQAAPQFVREYTLGATAVFAPDERWTHTLIAGVDGYELDNAQATFAPVLSPADSALLASQGSATRGTLRATSVLHLGTDARAATLTFSAEQGLLLRSPADGYTAPAAGASALSQSLMRDGGPTWQSNSGLTAQAAASLANTWFATGGLRVERDSRLPGSGIAVLPMLGLAAARDVGPFTMKVRSAFGEGIRPSAVGELASMGNARAPWRSLGPEKQAGTEVGLDVAFRDAMHVRVTRFDQHASGLIQQIALPAYSGLLMRGVRYDFQNMGEISNHGWEAEAEARVARLRLTGTLTAVDSRVERLATGYDGDLRPGDRMLQVPARTASIAVSYSDRRWFATIGGAQAFDWINYDELGLARAGLSGTAASQALAGPALRSFWRRYDSGPRVRASISRSLRDEFSIEVSAENLLNYQQSGPDNLAVVPGRTVMTGLQVRF